MVWIFFLKLICMIVLMNSMKAFCCRLDLCRCEYLPGGYSDSFRVLMIRNALSMKWFYAQRIDMPCSFPVRMGSIFRYIAYSMLAPGKEGKYSGKYRWLFPLGVPKGIAMYLVYEYYRLQYNRKQKR